MLQWHFVSKIGLSPRFAATAEKNTASRCHHSIFCGANMSGEKIALLAETVAWITESLISAMLSE
jgi:hypothetical protein